MIFGETLYDLLGASEDATPDEIRRAYRRMAKLHHPDHGGSAKEFERITEAYNQLKDPKLRAWYDRLLARSRDPVFAGIQEWLETDGAPPVMSPAPESDIGAAGAKGGFLGLIASAVPCAISMALFGETAVGAVVMFASFFGTIFAGARLAIWMERKHPGAVSQ